MSVFGWDIRTYRLVLDLLGLAALERNAVALVLETLGSDESLDLGGLGVRLLALALGLDLTSDDVLADLYKRGRERTRLLVFPSLFLLVYICIYLSHSDSARWCTLPGMLLSHPAAATTEQARTDVVAL